MKVKSTVNSKSYYVFVACISLAIMIMGATFAYFAATVTDDNTVKGSTATVTFGLFVNKITSVDMGFGLIPMYDDRAPFAAEAVCLDDLGNPVCQIYEITVKANSPTVMFLDGYITMEKKEGVDVAFTRVFKVDEVTGDNTGDSEQGSTDLGGNDSGLDGDNGIGELKFKTPDDFDHTTMVGTGTRGSGPEFSLNHAQDKQCLFVVNDMIGGKNEEDLINTYYAMVWLHDTGTNQNHIQGMQQAYTGSVTFVTAEGNEISATFD